MINCGALLQYMASLLARLLRRVSGGGSELLTAFIGYMAAKKLKVN